MTWSADDYLAHHGVQGQHWGVRHGPPYPIQDKVLRKGTRLNSVSHKYLHGDDYKKNKRWMYTYNPDDEWDKKVYEGPFSIYLAQRGAQFVKRHEFEVVDDLILADSGERMQEFKDLYNDSKTKKDVIKDIKNVQSMLVQYKVGNVKEQEEYKNFNADNIQTDDDYRIAYSIFNHAMEATYAYKSTSEYAKRIAAKYDGMVDDNNVNVYNKAHDPIVIFNADKFLKTLNEDLKVEDFLSIDEIKKNRDDVETELAKYGVKVKL